MQVPCELCLPDLNENAKATLSLEQQLRLEAEALSVMQTMAANNQRYLSASVVAEESSEVLVATLEALIAIDSRVQQRVAFEFVHVRVCVCVCVCVCV
jgi:hypothetical protein